MDCFDYMTNTSRTADKLRWDGVAEDERALPRRRRRQRDVTDKGEPIADIWRTMGYGVTQSKLTGESFQEAVLRMSGYDTEAKVRELEGRP